jgi:prophage regulatory protein
MSSAVSKRLLRLPGVKDKTGLKRSPIYELMKRGEFPKCIKIGRSSFWVEAELDAWIERRIEQDRGQGASKGGES